jgi:hypothetical protein
MPVGLGAMRVRTVVIGERPASDVDAVGAGAQSSG